MPAIDPLAPEVVYSLKSNIAYPIVGASASAIATTAQNRLQDALTDAFGNATVTIPAAMVQVVKQ